MGKIKHKYLLLNYFLGFPYKSYYINSFNQFIVAWLI